LDIVENAFIEVPRVCRTRNHDSSGLNSSDRFSRLDDFQPVSIPGRDSKSIKAGSNRLPLSAIWNGPTLWTSYQPIVVSSILDPPASRTRIFSHLAIRQIRIRPDAGWIAKKIIITFFALEPGEDQCDDVVRVITVKFIVVPHWSHRVGRTRVITGIKSA
jgi:hypothetical protein